jgi:predicted DNA-binding protein with PD1-like motif
MKVFEAKDGFLVRLERGEAIHESLTGFAREQGIEGASVQGIGAIMNAELGYYNLEFKEYERREVTDVTELLSLSGNLSLLDGNPFLHAHVVLMRQDRSFAGGHLFRGEVAVTGEFSIRQTDLELVRELDESLGLALLEAKPR